MTGSFDANLQHPSHLHQEQYGAYGPYVHPPLGSSDSGSGYVPIPSGSFSPVTNSNPLDHHHHMVSSAEAWNNNERVETSYY